MINLALDVWIRRQLQAVEEDGANMARLKLIHPEASQTYATWGAPFEDVPALVLEIEALFTSLPDEWAVGNHQVVLISMDKDGIDLARYPKTIRGKNRHAANNLLATEGQASISSMVTILQEQQRNLAGLINTQLAISTRTHQDDRQQIAEQYEYIKSIQQREILQAAERALTVASPINDELKGAFVTMIKEQAPAAIDIWKMIQQGKADEAKAALLQLAHNATGVQKAS